MKRYLLIALIAFMSTSALLAQEPVVINNDSVIPTKDTVVFKPEKKKLVFGDGFYNRDSTWKFGGYAGVTVSQVALYQWGPGGTNSFAILFAANGYANYKKGNIMWDNGLDIKWGLVANGLIRKAALANKNFQKSIDVLSLKSTFGYKVTDALFVSAKVGFESQFTRSFDYSLTDTANGSFRKFTVSKFGAPAILTVGPGLTWKPKDYFTLFFSPVQGKMTFVRADNPGRDTTTLPDGSFTANYYQDVDETRFGLKRGDSFMGELGLELDLLFQKDIIKNVNWKSHLNVFASYLNASYNTKIPVYYSANDSVGGITISEGRKFIPVVRWDNDIVLKINAYLSATLSARFVYQYNAIVPIDERNNATGEKGGDGINDKDKFGVPVTGINKLQIFEQFGVALSFKF